MSVERKTIRSDIPGHQVLLTGASSLASMTPEEGRRLVVGRGITLSGTISDCEHLVVEGSVAAKDFTAKRLDVLETGSFSGSGQVQDAIIAGRFDGHLTVTGRLTIKATGRLAGEIKYAAIETEAGAKIEGALSVLPAAEAPAPVAAKPQVNDNVEKLFDDKDDETIQERPRVFRRAIGY